MVNMDVDHYSNPKISTENIPKNAKNDNLQKTKWILKLKYKLIGAQFLHLACQGAINPLSPRQLCHCNKYIKHWLKKNIQLLKCLL